MPATLLDKTLSLGIAVLLTASTVFSLDSLAAASHTAAELARASAPLQAAATPAPQCRS